MDDSPAAEGLQPGHVPPCPSQALTRPCPCRAHAAGQPCPCQPAAPGRPLPDLTAVRLTEVPDSWPPYDDEVRAGEAHADGEPCASGDGSHTGTGQMEATGRMGAPGPDEDPVPGQHEDERGRRARGSGDTDADRWPSQFAQVLAETLAGSRPASQITPWTTQRARAHIRRLAPLLATEQRPRVQRVLTSHPMEDVVEVAVIVGFGSRTRALAARLERTGPQPATWGRAARRARWLCTAVESA